MFIVSGQENQSVFSDLINPSSVQWSDQPKEYWNCMTKVAKAPEAEKFNMVQNI